MSLTPGDILQSRYRVVALLGQGGMGAVYRALDLRLNVPMALKEQIPQPGLDAGLLTQLRQQFEQEAMTLARLSHPHLVRVTDFFEERGNAYLVMEFLEGESLADRIAREGRLPEAQVLAWAQQLLDALVYCHGQGIVHRDIKPQNILLRPDGRAVLVDFGLVKFWNPNAPQTRTVLRGMGTPEYAPPEQYGQRGQTTDPRSDLYSLGATLYHALTGQAPPTASDRIADPELFHPVRTLNPQVSATTDATLLRALEPARQKRWSTASEMASTFGSETTAPVSPPPTAPPPQPVSARSGGSGTAVMPQTHSQLQASEHWGIPIWAWVVGTLVVLFVLPVVWNALDRSTRATPTANATAMVTLTPEFAVASAPELGDTWTRPADDMVMVYVPAGEFQMGSEDGYDNEKPVHTVALDGFWIDRTEVTNAQYTRCVAAGTCRPSEYANDSAYNSAEQPVVGVSWNDAVTYATWVGGRLPTEAEWEYAARSPEGLIYPWGNTWDCAKGNFDEDCGSDNYRLTAPVGSFPAGASWVGALDIVGNVWEWVADRYGPYPSGRQVNFTAPASGDDRVLRGGAFDLNRRGARCAIRLRYAPHGRDRHGGFRVVVAPSRP